MFSIADKLENVRSRIQKSTKAAGRPEGSVLLLPVSKKHPAAAVLKAYASGVREVGENYVSEAVEKQDQLRALSADAAEQMTWHFIGPVQSNKTRLIAEHFAWVQSIDRLKIARRLNEQRPSELPPLNVLIQVNIDDEDTKSGIAPDEVMDLAREISEMPRLRLRGLMTIPSADANTAELTESMSKMRALFDALKSKFESVDTLSMGMSADMETAIKEGSTMVRVGTAIFGAREA